MLLGLLAPELAVYTAKREWGSTRILTKMMNEILLKVQALEFIQNKADKPQSRTARSGTQKTSASQLSKRGHSSMSQTSEYHTRADVSGFEYGSEVAEIPYFAETLAEWMDDKKNEPHGCPPVSAPSHMPVGYRSISRSQ